MNIDWKKHWKKVPGIIRHDFIRKLIAFGLAAIVFFPLFIKLKAQQIHENDLPTDEIEVKTPDIVSVPGDSKQIRLIRLEEKNPVLPLTIQKSFWARIWFSKNDAEYVLNQKKAFKKQPKPNQPYKVRISKDNIIPPFGIEIISGGREIIYEEHIEKTVKVEPDLDENGLHRNYIVEKITVSPERVTVSGPKSIVKNLKSIKTVPIPLHNITQSFDYSARLIPPSSRLKFSPEKVFLQVSIKENIKKREFKLQRIRIMDDSTNLNLEIIGSPYANITVSGTNDQIIALRPEQIKPYIDISNLNSPGIYSVDLGCWVAEKSIEVIKIEPQSVKVKISKK